MQSEYRIYAFPPYDGEISNTELVVDFTNWTPEDVVVSYDAAERQIIFTNNLTGEVHTETC